ncbi:SHOCT domain-containing protein [Thermosipho ferrireducens]|uniref:SHOCT domain-containing protein n=2 Tax=Thermosipho ferrireducens TaxID=2571116 RepID=A0ABX7SAJ1_9BACT|nr:SHOCT domain-containing protein [Thermosipho ferrireducens]
MHWFWWGYGPFSGFGLFSFLLSLGFIVLIGFVIYFVVKSAYKSSKNSKSFKSDSEEALRILNEKFAKGEISEEEYKRKKEIIMKDF